MGITKRDRQRSKGQSLALIMGFHHYYQRAQEAMGGPHSWPNGGFIDRPKKLWPGTQVTKDDRNNVINLDGLIKSSAWQE